MKSYQVLKKIIWILPIFIVVIFVLYYFIFRDIEQKNKNISDLQVSAQWQLQNNQYFKSVQDIVLNDQTGIDKINNMIISSDGDVGFIENFEKVAKDNGLEILIDSLTVDDISDLSKTNMTTLDIKARTRGSWIATYTFLKELDSLPFVIRIDRFALVGSTDTAVDPNSKKVPARVWQTVFEIHALKNK